jgi:lysophospholipase L1-like esterase
MSSTGIGSALYLVVPARLTNSGVYEMRTACLIAAFCCGPILTAWAQSEPQDSHDSSKWNKAIVEFERQDEKATPAQNGILFVGSSSIRMWDVKASFPDLPVINRGFGGSQLADAVHFIDRIVLKHKPQVVVMYAGDNDLSAGKSAERIFADFAEFVAILKKQLPECRLCYVAVKPSIKRWKLIDRIHETNALVKGYCDMHPDLEYIDIVTPMLGDDGKPRPELFAKDGLHLNAEGYKLWNKTLRPALKRHFATSE